jgi:PilZ domain
MAIYETRKGRIVGVIQAQAPVERPPANRRMAPRRRSTVPGTIYAGDARTAVQCTIADMSVTGARLILNAGWSDPFGLSTKSMDTCVLVIRHDRVMYECQIIRHGDRELGVRFLSAAKPIPVRGN